MSEGDDVYEDYLEPGEVLTDFLAPYSMWPDVRSKVETRFWKRESLYYTMMKDTPCVDRIEANIHYAFQHQGNVATNITGEPRSGKSTVARWLARKIHRTQFNSIENWDAKVLFARSYSRATDELHHLTRSFVDQGLNDEEVINQLQGYILIEDENQIEREKDSVKAQTDMKTIAESCASSGIHLIYLSPTRRGFGYFTLWVVGIDPKTNLNLSFYLDNEDVCHGYIRTVNVPPFDAYTTMKNRIVVQTLLDRGRVKAQVVEFDKGEEQPTEIMVPPDADFMQTLESYARFHLQPLVKKPEVVERWILYYFNTDMTHKKIAQQLGIDSPDTVGVSIRTLDEKLTNTLKGTILEDALGRYLNQRFRSSPNEPSFTSEPSPHPNQTSSTEPFFRRLGGRGQVDVQGPAGIVVNCKLFTEHRASWQLHASPEHQHPHPYLVLVTLTPRHTHTHVYPIHAEYLDTGSVEELEWEAWLDELQELITDASS